jgi:single-strand DNA-binding protein
MSFNKIIIVGNLGRDPELRYTPQGTPVCNFSVATNERWRDTGGETQERTTWFRVATWRKLAEVANQYLKKGSQVYVEGRLAVREYTDRDGVLRTSLEVNATDIQFLDRRPIDAEPESTADPGPAGDPHTPMTRDDDVPF